VTLYLDSSVLLRVVLRQAGALEDWPSVPHGVASALVQVECLRTLDRLRVRGALSDHDLAVRLEGAFRLLNAIELVEPTPVVLARAAQPMPMELGTLDAIHLATALLWQERTDTELVMATHDSALARAARAFGLRVVGL
jgi:predicted nucleic acid-binding protein